MFLDDEIVQIAESRDWTHWSTREKVNYEVLQILIKRFTDIGEEIKQKPMATDQDLLTEIKRVKRCYTLASSQLKKKGIDLRLEWNEIIEIVFHNSSLIPLLQNV